MNSNQRNLSIDDIYTNYMDYVRNSNRILNNTVAVLFNQQQTYNNMINSYNNNHSTNFNNIFTNPTYSRNYTYRPSPLPRYNYIHNRAFFNLNNSNESRNIPNINDLINSISYCIYCEIDNPTNNTCPITQRDFSNNDIVIMINNCRHIFEPQSIMTWFSRCSLCPLCRGSIINNRDNHNINQDTTNEPDEDNEQNDNNEMETNNTQDNNDFIYRYFSNYNDNNEQSTSNLIDQLANIISTEINRDQDFSGNIQIELGLHGR